MKMAKAALRLTKHNIALLKSLGIKLELAYNKDAAEKIAKQLKRRGHKVGIRPTTRNGRRVYYVIHYKPSKRKR